MASIGKALLASIYTHSNRALCSFRCLVLYRRLSQPKQTCYCSGLRSFSAYVVFQASEFPPGKHKTPTVLCPSFDDALGSGSLPPSRFLDIVFRPCSWIGITSHRGRKS